MKCTAHQSCDASVALIFAASQWEAGCGYIKGKRNPLGPYAPHIVFVDSHNRADYNLLLWGSVTGGQVIKGWARHVHK